MSLQLQLGLVESDKNDDTLLVWQYPNMSIPSSFIEKLPGLINVNSSPFAFLKLKNDWIYILKVSVKDEDSIPDVLTASLVSVSKVFYPEKFHQLLKLLMYQYINTNGDPTKILEGYLSIFTTGSFTNKIGSFLTSSYNDDDAISAAVSSNTIKELIDSFGQEIIILWNAILLKKRILVFDENLEKLLSVVSSLLHLCVHRKDFSILRPIVTADVIQIQDLASSGVFIAGTIDQSVVLQSSLYDVLVDIQDHRITVSNHATASLKLCSLHREVANLLVETSANAKSPQDIILALSKKTLSILSGLKKLTDENGKVTEESIAENVSNDATQQWLIKLASTENII